MTEAEMKIRIAELEQALSDLLSWFPDYPTDPEWRLKGGDQGADDAIAFARKIINPGDEM